jgi:hypothetical protein
MLARVLVPRDRAGTLTGVKSHQMIKSPRHEVTLTEIVRRFDPVALRRAVGLPDDLLCQPVKRRRAVANRRRRSNGPRGREAKPSSGSNPVLAGVAARMAEVIGLIRAGRWHAPSAGDDPRDLPPPDDDGGLAPSGVHKVPPDKSGSGSAALVEPED